MGAEARAKATCCGLRVAAVNVRGALALARGEGTQKRARGTASTLECTRVTSGCARQVWPDARVWAVEAGVVSGGVWRREA